jgi:ornithine carbamoyltransferase
LNALQRHFQNQDHSCPTMSVIKHFLDIDSFDRPALDAMLSKAAAVKAARAGRSRGEQDADAPLSGKVLAMIFERPSTRTRVSFEIGTRQLGGDVLMLSAAEMQLGRSETVADTARVMSRYVDAIMIRAANHATLLELASHATVPVINGLTNLTHPCQIMADLLTLQERKGHVSRLKIAWVGDCNNVAASWIHAVGIMGGTLTLGCPPELALTDDQHRWIRSKGANIKHTVSAEDAVTDADCVITDAWVSMHNSDSENRHNQLRPYQVNARLMKQAKPDALFMHCLPAHRNEEVTDDVIDGPHSVVFDEAENRLHAQKAILLHCLA